MSSGDSFRALLGVSRDTYPLGSEGPNLNLRPLYINSPHLRHLREKGARCRQRKLSGKGTSGEDKPISLTVWTLGPSRLGRRLLRADGSKSEG